MDRIVFAIGLRDDPHICAVGLAVNEMGGEYFHFDPSDGDWPVLTQVGDCSGTLAWADGRTVSMGQVGSIFCRYAIDSLRPASDLRDLQKYGMYERLQGMLAPLRSIETSRWINDPWIEARSDCKIFQRDLAKTLGLTVPSQVVGSDLEEIEDFFGAAACVIKPLSDTSLGVTADEVFCDRSIPTVDFLTPYTVEFDLARAKETASDGTPLLVQERIAKKADLRCMVIDDSVHAFAIDYVEGRPIDFRIAPADKIRLAEITIETSKRLVTLNRKLQVRYSACDLVLSQAGEEVFLEANVSGNWLFCDVAHDMRVTRDIAGKLLQR